jgi:hypothetical protein
MLHIEIITSLKYVVLPGKYFEKKYRYEYNSLFHFWKNQWSKAYQEIQLEHLVDETEFCRHEEVTGLFLNGQVIAVALTDFLKTDCPVQSKHKNFDNFNSSILDCISKLSNQNPIRTVNYLAIDGNYRNIYSIADIVVGLALLRTSELKNAILIGHSRNSRKTNELGYRLGGIPIQQNVLVNGELSDFMYIKNHPAYKEMNSLWENKISVFSPHIQNYYQSPQQNKTQQKGLQSESNYITNSL